MFYYFLGLMPHIGKILFTGAWVLTTFLSISLAIHARNIEHGEFKHDDDKEKHDSAFKIQKWWRKSQRQRDSDIVLVEYFDSFSGTVQEF